MHFELNDFVKWAVGKYKNMVLYLINNSGYLYLVESEEACYVYKSKRQKESKTA